MQRLEIPEAIMYPRYGNGRRYLFIGQRVYEVYIKMLLCLITCRRLDCVYVYICLLIIVLDISCITLQ
jgi:hypothetical protein